MELSITAIKQFKACRRAYQLRYVCGVKPVQVSDALETGRNYHAMLEELHETGIIPDVETKEAAMVNAYAKYIYPDMPDFVPEKEIESKIGRGKKLVGRVDGSVIGERAIVEHKTTSKGIEEYEFELQWDEQLLAYFLATGCRKAYYTICRKPTIRQKQSESEQEFAQRCLDWYAEDTFDKIRLLIIERTDEEVEKFKIELLAMYSEIRSADKNGSFYRNTCHCEKWGKRCEYAPICLDYDPNIEYIGFERRSHADNKDNG